MLQFAGMWSVYLSYPLLEVPLEGLKFGKSISKEQTLQKGLNFIFPITDEADENNAFEIRKRLFQLAAWENSEVSINDLGNYDMVNGASAFQSLLEEAAKKNHQILVIYPDIELLTTHYAALEVQNKNINPAIVSPELNLLDENYLKKICLHHPNYLFNLCLLGTQGHYVDRHSLDTFEKIFFQSLRLGALRTDIKISEPLIRNAHLFYMDLQTLRYSDFTNEIDPKPSGLWVEEACQLMRYAGMSESVDHIGVCGWPNRALDPLHHQVIAQIIWYFIDGLCHRIEDHPLNNEHFMRYRCHFDKKGMDLIFYKSKLTARWWLEIPEAIKGVMIPCNLEDYKTASKGELPEIVFQALKRA